MVRARSVAVATSSNTGRMNDRSRPVSSITSTTVEMGPWVVAARSAAAPSMANSPGGMPGQSQDQACPSTPPSNAPTVREGVNKPPGAPVRTQSTVAAGFSTSSTNSKAGATWLVNASCEMSLPLPSNCGNQMETKPSSPNPKNGAASRRQPCGLLRSAHVPTRTYPTETTPAIGPAKSAHATHEKELE